ncbi:MAG: ester cyclase [Gammaproteobacteria bacterium]|nr:ester cyclase [Gammaproteobacteria bacterium]
MNHEEAVRTFYDVMWNTYDKSVIPALFHEDFTFRGSLGELRTGHAGFADYVDMVHGALERFRCDIEQLVVEGDVACARMMFSGIQRGALLGHPPTGRQVRWAGAAMFTFRGERIADLWVLGDLYALERQLTGSPAGREGADPVR